MPNILRNGITALIICSILVVLAYDYVDKPVAFWVAHQHLNQDHIFAWLTHIPDIFTALLLIIYPLLVVRFCYNKWGYNDQVLLTAANSVAIASFIHMPLKILFGRYWPATWINHNPSLLRDNVYGFNWVHYGTAYASFPSGHTTVALAAMTVFWLAYPAWRWLTAAIALLVPIGLIAMNDHFVGDVIAGGFLGALTAFYTAKISGINYRKR